MIELDGGQHALACAKDTKRTQYLESRGFRVVRFWNNDVMINMEGVWQAIAVLVQAPLTPTLSPEGRGGKTSTPSPASRERAG